MTYVDGFLLPVPKKNLKAYRKLAQIGAKMWRKHGALQYFECWGDDLKAEWAPVKFPKMARAKPNETVVFAFIVYKSKGDRNRVNAKVMKEMKKAFDPKTPMPFDMKRMAFGGFKTIVQK